MTGVQTCALPILKSLNAGSFQLIENWTLEAIDRYAGNIIDKRDICNIIVDDGLERMARLLNGNNTSYFKSIAIGTGTTASTSADISLETEYTRNLATLSYEVPYKSKFTKTFVFGTGVLENITEAGLFDSIIATGSTMLARTVCSALAVSSDINLLVTATITVARI